MVRASSWCAVLSVVLFGCSPTTPMTTGPSAGERAGPASQERKILSVAALNSVKGFSPWLIGTTGGGARSLFEAHTNGLVSTDLVGNLEARLAEKLPSLDDGTIVILPDGRMQTVWRLRSGVKWHDGAPFTAEDVVFSWQVNTHPEIPSGGGQARQRLERVEATDISTVLITWTTTYYNALVLGFTDLWPFPRHLLGDAFQGDKEAFLNLPYWTTEYVHLGPFRVADFGLGENLVLERFNDYFRGRPRVQRLLIRIIPDANTVLTNLKAGALDIVTENAIAADVGAELRDEWARTGGGVVVHKQGNWRFINVQFNPEYGRPPELRQDVRVRRGLLVGIDRDAIRDVMVPGFSNTEGHTFMPTNDPRAPLVGTPFAHYRYDPNLAAQELAAAGWRRPAPAGRPDESGRSPSGQMLNAAGEPVQLYLRVTPNAAREVAIVAQSWRQLGLEVIEEIIPGSLTSERPYRATFPGMEITAQGNGDRILTRFDGRQCPRPPRFSGSQGGCYMNAELDRLMDKLFATIEDREQGLMLREIGELMAADLPALPMYFAVNIAVVRKGVRAITDDYAGATSTGNISRNAHLWDRG